MKTYSLGRGSKKAVKKFTTRQGLWMALMIDAAMLGIVLLFLFGFSKWIDRPASLTRTQIQSMILNTNPMYNIEESVGEYQLH
jgi:hypothetical protein